MLESMRSLIRQAPPLLAVVAWFLPGAGYWAIKQPGRAWIICLCVGMTFWLGILFGGAPNVIDRTSWPPWWYFAQMLAGVHVLLAELINVVAQRAPVGGKMIDLGQVFTGIAGLLNLLAVSFSLSRAYPVEAERRPAQTPASPHGRADA